MRERRRPDLDSPEDAAAAHVVAVLGGDYTLHDTGREQSQYDIDITTPDGVSVALEVTSYGGDDWRRTAARVRAAMENGNFRGQGLRHQWWVIFTSGRGIREIEAALQAILERLESEGHDMATTRYEGNDASLVETANALRDLGVSSVSVWDAEPDPDEPRIVLSQATSSIGTAGALTAAIEAVFEKRDNQTKLERAERDERHLYVLMEHDGASAVLEGVWPLPASPADPTSVIDVLWVYSPSSSSRLFRTRPGAQEWECFSTHTGATRTIEDASLDGLRDWRAPWRALDPARPRCRMNPRVSARCGRVFKTCAVW
jgi:hypothetical protein